MDLDSILSQFGEKPKSKSLDFDIDKLLSEFEVKAETLPKDIKKIIVNTDPKPPISGISKEASDELNATRASKSGRANPRNLLPTTNVIESIADAFNSGLSTFSEGLSDVSEKKPASGVGKIGLGALATIFSPVTGLIEGGIATPIADITGSKDIGERAGLVASAGLPVSKATKATIASIPKNKALSTLVENIGRENLPAVVQAMKANPRLGPADLSPRVLQDTQHLFTSDGPQIDYLAKTSANRMGSRKSAIEEAYDISGGAPVTLSQKMLDLAEAAKKVGNEQINPIVKSAKPVDTSRTVSAIDAILKPGAMSKVSIDSELPLNAIKKELGEVRSFLANKTEVRTDPEDLHKFQSRLRVTAENLLKSTDGQSKNLGNALLTVRRNLIDDIDKSAKGYKDALNSYREEKHIGDAFTKGFNEVISGSKKMENDPSFTKKWFDSLTDAEKQAAKEGVRARIGTEIGIAKNGALAGESLARSDFNKEKLKIFFGEAETNKLLKTLDEERAIANTHNKIIEGSQTAMRSASKSQFALPTKTEVMKSAPAVAAVETGNFFMGGMPGAGSVLLGAAKVGAMAKDAVKMKLAREHNARYAKYALPTEGPQRDELIRALEAHIPGPKPSMLARIASNSPISP